MPLSLSVSRTAAVPARRATARPSRRRSRSRRSRTSRAGGWSSRPARPASSCASRPSWLSLSVAVDHEPIRPDDLRQARVWTSTSASRTPRARRRGARRSARRCARPSPRVERNGLPITPDGVNSWWSVAKRKNSWPWKATSGAPSLLDERVRDRRRALGHLRDGAVHPHQVLVVRHHLRGLELARVPARRLLGRVLHDVVDQRQVALAVEARHRDHARRCRSAGGAAAAR